MSDSNNIDVAEGQWRCRQNWTTYWRDSDFTQKKQYPITKEFFQSMSTISKTKNDKDVASSSPPQAKLDKAAEMRNAEINTAAAVLSLSGPCRQVGDVYLACVATAGLGMCRSLRYNFEQCAKATSEESKEMLAGIGNQMFGYVENQDEQLLQAARMINLHNLSNRQAMEQQPSGQN